MWSDINIPALQGQQSQPFGVSDWDTVNVGGYPIYAQDYSGGQLFVGNMGDFTGLDIPTIQSVNSYMQTSNSQEWRDANFNVLASIDVNGKMGIGTTPSTWLHVLGTTEQLRLGYDASKYFSTTVGSTGSTTFNLTGTSPRFDFLKNVNVTGNITTSTGGSWVGYGACYLASGTLGHCTTALNSTGSCTCAGN
jgi:hypothetical protein